MSNSSDGNSILQWIAVLCGNYGLTLYQQVILKDLVRSING